MMLTRLKQVNTVHRELKTTLEEKIVAYFKVSRDLCTNTKSPQKLLKTVAMLVENPTVIQHGVS
jgi:hypothetical protein